MATIDLSRQATNFAKHFDSTRMQQGRVLTDDDFNEQVRLAGEDARRTRVDLIGPAGSPDDGFRIDAPQVLNGKLTFVIKAGAFYLGGLRLTLEQDEYYHLQKDWLQQGENAADRLDQPAAVRHDLVYLETWQQAVSAVEDGELFEVALGARDSSARIRTMRQVRVRPDVTLTDCGGAFGSLLTDLVKDGTLDDGAELIADARLKVEPDGTAGTPDLCSPPVAGGYLGAENQAIRVQLLSDKEFTWGFDNAAPLYRVQLTTDSAGVSRRLVMLTEPTDQAHWPLSGQTVELLPWSAALVNNQKLAGLHGYLAKVNGSYDPNTQTFFIDTPPPAPAGAPPHAFGEHWKERNDPGLGDATVLDDEGEFFYLRCWNRGSDTASPARIPFAPGTAVSLPHTGLKLTFAGTQFRADDYWIIAVRPDSPALLMPWDFDPTRPPNGLLPYDGRPAHGVRRWFTPLAVIEWTPGAPTTGVVLHDCRVNLPPLTRLRTTCCTFTVGDGVTSHGQFDSIQKAVDQLPADGGRICLLPGTFHENVRIVNRQDIVICGCGPRSVVQGLDPAQPGTAAEPVISIIGGSRFVLEKFAVQADPTGLGIYIYGNNPYSKLDQEAQSVVTGIVLTELTVSAVLQSAIRARFVRDLTIRYCKLTNLDRPGYGQTLVVLGDDVQIERNVIEVSSERETVLAGPPAGIFTPGTQTAGGMQIEGMSDRVRIIDNLIRGGSGNGITLGSVAFLLVGGIGAPPDDPLGGKMPPLDPCAQCDPINQIPFPTGGGGAKIVDAGPLSEVLIERNRIFQMGMCGVGVARFWDLRGEDMFIHVSQLTILGNHIRECLQREIAEPPPLLAPFVGYGGISLGDVFELIAYDNVIEHCGLSPQEPVCGIFVLQGEGCDLSRNRVLENGAPLQPKFGAVGTPKFKLGHRGGIVVVFALAPTLANVPVGKALGLPQPSGEPAARIHENIVTAPYGQALHLNALGPVSIEGNHLVSRGVAPGLSAAFSSQIAATVWLLDLGFSNELYLGYFAYVLGLKNPPSKTGLDQFGIGRVLATGQVLFNDNRVTFDATSPTISLAFSSVLIATADDLSFQDNHCDCNLLNDFVVVQGALLGISTRINGNRFTEGAYNALFSATTVGLWANTTALNQATHCILGTGLRLKLAFNTEIIGVNPLFGGKQITCDMIQKMFSTSASAHP